MTVLFTLFLLTFPGAQASDSTVNQVSLEGKFLDRKDLPEDFHFPLLELEFAVLRVRFENRGSRPWSLEEEKLEIRDRKGKLLPKALLTEIVPKILKSDVYRRSNRAIHGQAGYPYPAGHPGIYGNPYVYQGGRIGTTSGVKVVSATQAQEIRQTLEEHQVKSKVLAPGEVLEGLVYLKSDKTASELAGSVLHVDKAGSLKLE